MLIWFSGLIRGAIAFALSLEINKEIAPHRDQMVSTTLMMVLMTTVVLGGIMSAFARLIGLDIETAEDEDEQEGSKAERLTDIIFKEKKKSWLQRKFHWLDDHVIKPLFGGNMSKVKIHEEEEKLEEERRTQFIKIQAMKTHQRRSENAKNLNNRISEAYNANNKNSRNTNFDNDKANSLMKGTQLDMIREDEEDD
jgi:NhaP-type Na+/H+ or K+/H+ antiporter